jgi:WD40 repeat protein
MKRFNNTNNPDKYFTMLESNSQTSNKERILYLSYNQDYSCISCGTTDGFVIYNVDPFKIRYQQKFGKGIGIAEIYYTSNLIALVGGGDDPMYSTNKLVIWDDYQGKKICDIDAEHRILGVNLNKECFAIVCQNSIKLYQFQDMKFLTKIETYDNPNGVCALSTNEQTSIIVTPGLKPGYVNVTDYVSNIHKTFRVSDHPINNLTLNNDATKVATASTLGTLVRVFDLPTQTKFREVRRGSDSCEIYGIHFSSDSKCLAVTSSKNTVHVFSLCKEYKNTKSTLQPLGLISGFFNSEWSLFNVEWKPPTANADSDDDEITFDPLCTKHIAAIPLFDEKEEIYKMFTVGYDGKFLTHQFQFKPQKIEKLKGGSLFKLDRS